MFQEKTSISTNLVIKWQWEYLSNTSIMLLLFVREFSVTWVCGCRLCAMRVLRAFCMSIVCYVGVVCACVCHSRRAVSAQWAGVCGRAGAVFPREVVGSHRRSRPHTAAQHTAPSDTQHKLMNRSFVEQLAERTDYAVNGTRIQLPIRINIYAYYLYFRVFIKYKVYLIFFMYPYVSLSDIQVGK